MGRPALIAETLERSQDLLRAFRAAAGLPADSAADMLSATATDPSFPGGLLTLRPGGESSEAIFYAAAATTGDWRRLRPLLLAFAGPTLTDFTGAPTTLAPNSPQEQVLTRAGLAMIARLRAPPETAISACRALQRLAGLVAQAPPDSRPAPESTGRLLARIRDHLNNFAIDDARRLLARCRTEHRLDALNLRFLEIEILARARDWRAIVDLPGFDDLLQTRRPPAVTAALLEALYWTAFGEREADTAYEGVVRSRARSLIRLPAPADLGDGGWRLHGLEALASDPQNVELARLALESGANLGALAEQLTALGGAQPAPAVGPRAVEELDLATAVATADISGSLSAFEQVQKLLGTLSDAERAALLDEAQPRASLAAMTATFGPTAPPQDWSAWLARITDPDFTAALAIARQGAAEWPARLGDPVQIAALAAQLLAAPDAPPFGDRLIEALPHFVGWLLRDPDFPRPGGVVLYEAALDRVLLSGRNSTPLLDSASVLTRGLLALGPSAEAYRRFLSDLLEASGEAAGLRTAYWLIELLETTLAYPAPDKGARDQLWHSALARLSPIVSQLSPLQRVSLRRLAQSAGWSNAFPEPVRDDASGEQEASLAAQLADKMLAIYTLTESAGAQAAAALHEIAPTVDVRVNSEFDGSKALRSLAENADLFVIVAGAATHAATDAIRARRGNRPLVYAAGKGAVSILRAVEEWALRASTKQ